MRHLAKTASTLAVVGIGTALIAQHRAEGHEHATPVSDEARAEGAAFVATDCVLELPDGLPQSFSVELPLPGRQLTLHLEKNSVFGGNTRFLVADGAGAAREIDPGLDRSYLGQVGERPEFAVSAVLTTDGLIANIIRPGRESIMIEPLPGAADALLHQISTPQTGDHQDHHHGTPADSDAPPPCLAGGEMAASTGPIATMFTRLGSTLTLVPLSPDSTATLPPTRVMDVLEFEIGVEIGSKAFLATDTYNSNMATAQASAQSLIGNLDSRYLRSAGVKHRLGTVMIRSDAGTDPLRDSVSSGNSSSLSAFKDYWNGHSGEVGSSHDLAVYHVKASPSGIAYVNSVGTSSRYALCCGNSTWSWADGTITHEFGHSWNLRHTGDGPISEYDYGSGDPPPSQFYESKPRDGSGATAAGGSHVFISPMHGGGDHNIGRLASDEANTVYSIREGKRGHGDLVADPGPIAPFGHRDRFTITSREASAIDVINNDHDCNNDVLDVRLLDTVSHRGGTISLSAGSGPGGRSEILYTPPENPQDSTDFFHYTVFDTTGRTDWGAVYITLDLPNTIFFEESFTYPEGDLAGNQNSGNTWETITDAGSATVAANSVAPQTQEPLLVSGGSVNQIGSARHAIEVPAAMGTDGSTIYVSFVQQFTDDPTGIENRAKMVEFWNGSAAGDSIISFGTDTNPAAPDYGLLLDKNGGNVALDVGSADNEAHLIVLKIEYGASDADQISVFMDPGEFEPLIPLASASYSNLAFNRVGFGSFQGGSQKVDEIRIGNSYPVVAPIDTGLRLRESFDYPAGDLAGRSNDGGTWAVHNTGGSTVVVDGSVPVSSVPDLATSGGRAVQALNHRESLSLPATAAGGEDGSTVYISFIQKFTDELVGIEGRAKMVEFWDGAVSSNSIFSFGTDANPLAPDYGLFIDKNGGNVPVDAGTADNQAHLVVLKVEYGAGDADRISVFIDPGATEPAVATASADYGNLAFNRVGLGTFQGGSQEVDEIRIGTSFEAVVPIDTGLRFQESFDYEAGDLSGNSYEGKPWGVLNSGGSTLVADDEPSGPLFPGLAAEGGRAVQAGSHRVSLELPSSASGGSDGTTTYVGFVQRFTDDTAGIENRAKMVEFWRDAPTNNTVLSFGTDAIAAAPDYGLLVDKNAGNVALDLGTPDTHPHLVVFKIEYGAGDVDTVSVFIDPGETEPPVADASTTYSDLSFDRVGFGSFQGGSQEVDEIRIGLRYESVVVITDPDSDGDGLPDDFEREHYGGDLGATDGSDDLDGDGQCDRDEFAAGTDPLDPDSGLWFTSDGIEPSGADAFTLRWYSVAGKSYSVWFNTGLDPVGWLLWVPSVVAAGETTSRVVVGSGPTGFFQVRVNP